MKNLLRLDYEKILLLSTTIFRGDYRPDLRNTRVVDIIEELNGYHAKIDVYDPWVNAEEAMDEYSIELVESPTAGDYDAIILAVGHNQFKALGSKDIRAFGKENAVLFDVKYVLPKDEVDARL